MNTPREDTQMRAIAEQAASWLCELAEGDLKQREAFVTWIKHSPRHVAAFMEVSATWTEFGSMPVASAQELNTVIAAAIASDDRANVIPLQKAPAATRAAAAPVAALVPRNRRRTMAGIAAAAALLAVGALGIARWIAESRVYSTELGEQRAFTLADGSLLNLNTQSKVRVRFSAQERSVQLLEGEALFTVRHEARRPFRVKSAGTVIQALGTQFNVYRRNASTTVSVLEGVVQISSPTAPVKPQLVAGEQANVVVGSTVIKRPKGDVRKAVAWRERRLVFEDERLEDIAAEVNRYASRPLKIEGDATKDQRFTGTFSADDPESLLEFLALNANLRLIEEAAVVRIQTINR